ncbi:MULTISPECIES: CHAT domain-containing protein [unclassified Leptolyngbya]|uniref:CHAT domain-containing protein n=1 Tax=unclassified Leptolyngbya TaxID=2650499 RepID=UPI001682F921|nr:MULTISPECIES: CHAT domain-containing protein [unclassified Leptolyngbya]MBD1912478.1 CHAT domain-containing protein [Leptolyngbya sp. FACHB-8]MBD2156511.1 CHAT domain-containing protein [Leptolyngbya sp. FACHB-16]
MPENPCLRLAIDRLNATAQSNHYAIWVIQAPHQAGYAHNDQTWTEPLNKSWQAWQALFSSQPLPDVQNLPRLQFPTPEGNEEIPTNYTSRLMQYLGIMLWEWLFDGPIQNSLDQSRGISMGMEQPLRLRLEIRDPNLVTIPWEIMQSRPGQRAMGLHHEQLLFSRTTYDVDPLVLGEEDRSLNILLVQGVKALGTESPFEVEKPLNLEAEAEAIAQAFRSGSDISIGANWRNSAHCEVDILVQPTPAELTRYLERKHYNVLFYSGHGMPGPDGGLLYLRPDATLNGTELAQLLTRCRVKLAVFNACWGAQPDMRNGAFIPRSSLAEVLIHHGVPAVLGMRDTIADNEALSFIQRFARSLSDRSPIDAAVAVARQHLLTLYRFNSPAWSLPVLYMHPEFNGELLRPVHDSATTQMPPDTPSHMMGLQIPPAYLRSLETIETPWPIQGGRMRIGSLDNNDLVLRGAGVSRRHAEIFYRDAADGGEMQSGYFLRDFSRFGTLMLRSDNRWYKIHQQEVPLRSRTQLCFGTHKVEFLVDEM